MGCKAYKQCSGTKPGGTIICPNNAFCIQLQKGHICASTKDPECDKPDTPDGKILCTDFGYYPDPLNCTLYHYCEGSDKISESMACRRGYVFNENWEKGLPHCRLPVSNLDCNKIDCKVSGTTGYGRGNKYYAYCFVGSKKIDYSINMCAENYIFNGNICVPNCKVAGDKFEIPGVLDKYYECYRESIGAATIKFDELPCPNRTYFSDIDKDCLPVIL